MKKIQQGKERGNESRNGGSTISGSVSQGKPPSSGDSFPEKLDKVSTGNVRETALQAVALGRESCLSSTMPTIMLSHLFPSQHLLLF